MENVGGKSLLFTVGHSNRPLTEFLALLNSHKLTLVVDVRALPGSRRHPRFNQDALADALAAADIRYLHFPGLGGRRRGSRDSQNTGWRNASFRAYADYMQTAEFQSSVEELTELARSERLAIMCAEAVPWRCHRMLLSDALLVRGIEVLHILGSSSSRSHMLTNSARVHGTRITYPAASLQMDFDGGDEGVDKF